MAIYRLEAKIVSRAKGGRSVVAASAYRSASRLRDDRAKMTHDYTARNKDVVATMILCPAGAPEWATHPETLWNQVEQSEKRKDAQLAREFVLALPKELSTDQQIQVSREWAEQKLVAAGMIVEVSLHHPKSGKNPHAHMLCTLRKLDEDHFNAKKSREWNDKKLLKEQRVSWEEFANAALEKAGRPERIDHRSLKDRNIDRIPEPKIGVAATAMKRRGAVEDPERFRFWRRVQMLNELRPWARAIERFGEIPQQGMGKTWWERSLLMTKEVGKTIHDTVRDTWEALIHARMPGHSGPDLTPNRDIEPSR